MERRDARGALCNVQRTAIVGADRLHDSHVCRPSITGRAGGSALAEGERRRQRRDADVRRRHPRIGGFLLAVAEEPQSIRAWEQGARGEREVGAWLERLSAPGAIVLHDRLRPGTRANIDHLVVAPSGVWVVDSKRYKGRIERRDRGGWFRSDDRLYVNGHDRTGLVREMTKQVDAVKAVVGDTQVTVHPTLCFVDAEWPVFARPFRIDGVFVAWPKALNKAIENAPGARTDIAQIAERISSRLPPAT